MSLPGASWGAAGRYIRICTDAGSNPDVAAKIAPLVPVPVKRAKPGTDVQLIISHDVQRLGLHLLVSAEPDFQVLSEASDGKTALALAQEKAPDIAVLDAALPDMPALTLAYFLTQRCPRCQVLMLTEDCGKEWLTTALRSGARGFIPKGRVARHLLPALRALADHRPYWEEAVPDELLDEMIGAHVSPPPTELSKREWQIVQMAADGRTSKEIAEALSDSTDAIDALRTRLRRRLGFHSSADLVRYVTTHRQN